MKLQLFLQPAKKFIDIKIGIAGAIVMGGVVFCINYFPTLSLSGSITAAIKQGAYTFLFGGTLMKACEYLAINIRKQFIAILASVIIPSALTLLLTYIIHNMKGTPKPLESSLPTLIIIPATAIWGIKKRIQMNPRN